MVKIINFGWIFERIPERWVYKDWLQIILKFGLDLLKYTLYKTQIQDASVRIQILIPNGFKIVQFIDLLTGKNWKFIGTFLEYILLFIINVITHKILKTFVLISK